jgi:hypothetical protein
MFICFIALNAISSRPLRPLQMLYVAILIFVPLLSSLVVCCPVVLVSHAGASMGVAIGAAT